ncbi:hypothetical protein BC826DRAFT_410943 [Russula brevipes]|nr:hypothetical protein BC826DRAFT_410943 [Russula brevipes]
MRPASRTPRDFWPTSPPFPNPRPRTSSCEFANIVITSCILFWLEADSSWSASIPGPFLFSRVSRLISGLIPGPSYHEKKKRSDAWDAPYGFAPSSAGLGARCPGLSCELRQRGGATVCVWDNSGSEWNRTRHCHTKKVCRARVAPPILDAHREAT